MTHQSIELYRNSCDFATRSFNKISKTVLIDHQPSTICLKYRIGEMPAEAIQKWTSKIQWKR